MTSLDNIEYQKYKAEVQGRWGNTEAYKEHIEKSKDYTKDKFDNIATEMDNIFAQLTLCMKNGDTPDSAEVQSIVKALQSHITENYYKCTNEILSDLGQMYVCDERFKNNIDKHADGTADFVCQAIKIYCNR